MWERAPLSHLLTASPSVYIPLAVEQSISVPAQEHPARVAEPPAHHSNVAIFETDEEAKLILEVANISQPESEQNEYGAKVISVGFLLVLSSPAENPGL